jgi:hypothetical protein
MSKVFSLAGARAVAAREDKGTVVILTDEHGDALQCQQPDGTVEDAQVVVTGKLSSTFKKAEQRINDRTIKRRALEITADMLERNELEKIAACVKSWNLTDGGTPIELNTENFIAVAQAAPWIKERIEKVMSEPARFLD